MSHNSTLTSLLEPALPAEGRLRLLVTFEKKQDSTQGLEIGNAIFTTAIVMTGMQLLGPDVGTQR